MRIVIIGASGFVGKHLCTFLLSKGHSVTGISRHRPQDLSHDQFTFVSANPTEPGAWQEAVSSSDSVINLTGQSVFHYWTAAYKESIRQSRIDSTKHMVEALDSNTLVINASAVGFYGNQGDHELQESSPCGTDFLATVCNTWEDEAIKASKKGSRVVLTRFGIILGASGGALQQMSTAFKFYLGGPIGDGKQWMPWIHIDDVTSAIEHILNTPTLTGPVNFCTPVATTNLQFSKALAAVLNRPCWFKVPAPMLKCILGEFSGCLLSSQKVIPKKLSESGFSFQYPTIEKALTHLLP